MSFQVKSFSAIVERMITYISNNTDLITDFNKASTNRTILEAVAWVIKDILNDIFLAFRNNLSTFIYEAFGFVTKDSEKAIGTVRFVSNSPPAADIIIPINTVVETDEGIGFVTTEEGVQLLGETTTTDIPVIAAAGGKSGNVKVDTITNIVTAISGIDAVTNTVPTTGGSDAESDEDAQTRFQKFVTNLARSTVFGIEAGAETVPGVVQAFLYETTTLGLLYLYIDDGTGGASSALLDDVQFVIEGDGTEENSGYRGAGTVILYKPAVRLDITIEQTLFVKQGYTESLQEDVETGQTEFVNSRKIGEVLIKNKLEDEVFKFIEVIDISLTNPADNVIPVKEDGEVVKISSIDSTLVEVT